MIATRNPLTQTNTYNKQETRMYPIWNDAHEFEEPSGEKRVIQNKLGGDGSRRKQNI
jgi:hypothetical protein